MKRLAIGFAILVAVLLIVNATYSWHIGRQLDGRLAKLRAAGEPTSFAELAPKPIPPEQDAAVHLQRCHTELESFASAEGRFSSTPVGLAIDERMDQGKEPTKEQMVAIRDLVGNYPTLQHSLEQAAACKGYASQIDFTVADSQLMEEIISSAGSRRTPSRFLRWKITILLAEGKQEEALRIGLVMLRLARLYGNEPVLVNGLVSIAIRGMAVNDLNLVLRAGPLSEELRKELDQELALHDDPKWIQHVMKTERAVNLSLSKSLFAEAWWLPWLARGLEVDTIDYHERLLPIITQPWHKSHTLIQSLNTDGSYSTYVSGTLIGLLTPAIDAASEAFNRNTALLRCLRILNELTAYAQANGQEAEGLDDLDLPDAAKRDPFSCQPLRLKWTDEGWVVYTVFKNGTDDGGDFEDQADWGLGPAGYPGAK